MIYLESFRLPSEADETSYLFGCPKLDMTCYSVNNVYPFKLFPQKDLTRLDFSSVTLIYGGNGSGKSTLLNVIAQRLRLYRTSPFSRTPFYEDYLGSAATLRREIRRPPRGVASSPATTFSTSCSISAP